MQHVKPNNKTKSKRRRARRKGKQGDCLRVYDTSYSNSLETLADIQHASALCKIHGYIISARRPISIGGSVGRRGDLVHSHKVRDECHIPLAELRVEEEPDLTRRQEMQAHPNSAVVQLEVAPHALRRPKP